MIGTRASRSAQPRSKARAIPSRPLSIEHRPRLPDGRTVGIYLYVKDQDDRRTHVVYNRRYERSGWAISSTKRSPTASARLDAPEVSTPRRANLAPWMDLTDLLLALESTPAYATGAACYRTTAAKTDASRVNRRVSGTADPLHGNDWPLNPRRSRHAVRLPTRSAPTSCPRTAPSTSTRPQRPRGGGQLRGRHVFLRVHEGPRLVHMDALAGKVPQHALLVLGDRTVAKSLRRHCAVNCRVALRHVPWDGAGGVSEVRPYQVACGTQQPNNGRVVTPGRGEYVGLALTAEAPTTRHLSAGNIGGRAK